MFQKLKQDLYRNIKNIPGWRTKRKIVVIECDDWGSIRMPSKEVYDELLKKGLRVDSGWHNMYDTLETDKDLEQMFETLVSVIDKNGNPAVMTAVTNVANPDFDKIRASGFKKYYYEPFTETLKRYYPGSSVFELWKEGMSNGIFIPEHHGREHISVQLWMDKLKEGNEELLLAFNMGFVSLDIPGVPEPAREFRSEFYFTSEDQKPFLINSVKEGVVLFKEIFGFKPTVFVPGNAIFHPDLEEVVAQCGVEFLWVNHKMAYPATGGELKYRHFIPGQKGPYGIIYYTRNCAFEPNSPDYNGIGSTMKQIAAAFRWGKPANISTHRANFTGGIDPKNREHGLNELLLLLKAIVKKWPDVEFMSSKYALHLLKNKNL